MFLKKKKKVLTLKIILGGNTCYLGLTAQLILNKLIAPLRLFF